MNADDHDASAGNNQSTLANLKEQAGEKVSQVADTLKQEAVRREEGIRGSLSKQADQLASALRSAKSEIDPDSSIGRMFDYAAESVGSLAQNMKATDATDIVHGVRDFARERPGAFLGICALGGFAAARFLLAGTPDGRRNGTGSRSGSSYSGSSSSSGYPGSSTRSYGTTTDSGSSQARATTGSMSGAGSSEAGMGQAGKASRGTGTSSGPGLSSTSTAGSTSGPGTSGNSMGGAGSGIKPSSSTIGGTSPATGTSGHGIGGSGAGSEIGGDPSGRSAGTGSTGGSSGTQGQSSSNMPASDRNGGRND